ncbi:MAG: hypothetical protein VB025_14560 [Sphaerochaeta sp.]|nr:hypothetical protein [Sphaerochaeta sp.]
MKLCKIMLHLWHKIRPFPEYAADCAQLVTKDGIFGYGMRCHRHRDKVAGGKASPGVRGGNAGVIAVLFHSYFNPFELAVLLVDFILSSPHTRDVGQEFYLPPASTEVIAMMQGLSQDAAPAEL